MGNIKKIGMAINYNYPDYGGMLQAYASFRKIKELGYEPEAINIEMLSGSIKKRKLKYFAKNIFDLSIVREKSQIVKKKLKIKLDKNFGMNMRIRNLAFESFCHKHFVVSKEYKSWSELSEACYFYDAIVVGSDQLWLPSNIEGDYYTLSFVPDNVKKIAYATSFGVERIPKQQYKKTKKFLNRFDYLSAREKSGVDIIKEFTGRNVQQVCDPALLLSANEWGIVSGDKKIIDGNYIFCYFMGDNPSHREFVKQLRKKTGYKVVSLLHLDQFIAGDENYADETPYDISPADFVNLIKNAEYVCTDSFHGTVFSMIFKREFFTFKRFTQNATLSTNNRIDSLLGYMGMENCIIEDGYIMDEMLERRTDFETVHKKLDTFRSNSIMYLVNAINS